jgi:hypothetical protein
MILNDDLPSPMNVPRGCRFHTRCPFAQERCRSEEPQLEGGTHRVACHFWEKIARSAPPVAADPAAAQGNPYVSGLIERFHGRAATPPDA